MSPYYLVSRKPQYPENPKYPKTAIPRKPQNPNPKDPVGLRPPHHKGQSRHVQAIEEGLK